MPENNKIDNTEESKNIDVNIQSDSLFADHDNTSAKENSNLVEVGLINPYLIHQPLKYGKKLYISEFLAEKFIQGVAFLSIGFIMAIFFYVFRESLYAFKNPEQAIETTFNAKPTNNAGADKSTDGMKQESYGGVEKDIPAGGDASGEMKQESYGGVEKDIPASGAASGEMKQESYGGVEKDIPAGGDASGEMKQESYGGVEKNITSDVITELNPSDLQSGGEEQPVTFKQLFQANDYIDNKPRHIWQPISTVPKFSFIPLIMGAFKVTMIGILIAAPIAILAAIFTVAFAPKWLKEIIKPAIEILAGFPSVVLGFFCLMTLASVIQHFFGTTYRLNSFVGGIGMALAVIPIIYTLTEDALSAVPKYMKEASLALGASRWQTVVKVMLPAATPGVFAALLLGFGRAFGETMIALMATGNAALTSINLFDSVRTMAATIGAEMAEVESHSVHYGILFLIGASLFLVTFCLNAVAEFYVRKRLLKRFQGE